MSCIASEADVTIISKEEYANQHNNKLDATYLSCVVGEVVNIKLPIAVISVFCWPWFC